MELCDIGASGLRLLDYLREQALLIVIDACLMNRAPGEILVQEPDLDVPLANSTSLHQIGPLDTLSLAKHLYAQNMPHRVLFIMVETRDIDAATEKKHVGRCWGYWIGRLGHASPVIPGAAKGRNQKIASETFGLLTKKIALLPK